MASKHDKTHPSRVWVNRGDVDTPVAWAIEWSRSLPSIPGYRHRDHEESIG